MTADSVSVEIAGAHRSREKIANRRRSLPPNLATDNNERVQGGRFCTDLMPAEPL